MVRRTGAGGTEHPPEGLTDSGVRLFTLGYQGRDLFEVLQILRRLSVRQVIDIRENPLSRKPGFSEAELRDALGEIGVTYVALPELGCTRASRHAFWRGDSAVSFFEQYRSQLAERPRAFSDLVQRVRSKRSLLLCLERASSHCHRSVLIERLREEGIEVEDL